MKRLVLLWCMVGGMLVSTAHAEENQDTVRTDASSIIWEDDPVVAALDSLLSTPYFEAFALPEFDTVGHTRIDTLPTYPSSYYREVLQGLDARTPFDLVYNDRVQAFINLYAVKRREQTARMLGLQHHYFPMIEEVLAKYDMPYELKYLAVVESALNPKARSRAGAVGMWQFMYSTGKIYGLLQNSYMDERMDPIKATEAACKYLGFLYDVYGKWDLALAAYNCGPGNVNRAMRRSGSRDGNYWDLYPYLPRETRGYVPAFIAVNYIMNNHEAHGISPIAPMLTFFETDTVHVSGSVSFDYLSRHLDLTQEELEFLNPAYTRRVVPAYSNETSILRLPREKMGAFVQNETAIYQADKVAANDGSQIKKFEEDRIYYRVRSGDYLGKIAQRYHVSVSSLRRWNNLRGNTIRVGQRLVIYPNGSRNMASSQPKRSNASSKKVEIKEGNKIYYQIQPGDTLWDIARARGTSVDHLRQLNSHLNTRKLKPGMKIVVSTNG